MDTTPLLATNSITAGYIPELDIISDCSIQLNKGELIGIIGPNGAGKSTLLKVIFGLLKPRAGQVLLEGNDITNVPTHKLVSLGIGYIPQIQNIFSSLSVADNLKMGAYRDSMMLEERIERVFELFPQLEEHKRTRAGLLSGGEAQMVAIGRALMMNPHIMLLDEPSAGLSPINQKITFESIKNVVKAGVSAIMVEQNARTCLEICDRAYVLDEGTNVYTDTGENLLHNPKVIELYLGSLAQANKSRD